MHIRQSRPGVDRIIVRLSGNRMILESDARFVLDTKFEPHAFRGEDSPRIGRRFGWRTHPRLI